MVEPSRFTVMFSDEEGEEGEEEAARRDGVFTHGMLALPLSGIKERRAVTLAHTKAAARTFMSSFIRPPEQKGWGGGVRLNGKLEGPRESRGETHKHLHARRNQL